MPTKQENVEKLQTLRQQILAGGGERSKEKQHSKNKLTARERLNILLDEDTFEELDALVVHRCHDFGLEKNTKPLEMGLSLVLAK